MERAQQGLTAAKIREAAELASVTDSEQDLLRRAALILADLLEALQDD